MIKEDCLVGSNDIEDYIDVDELKKISDVEKKTMLDLASSYKEAREAFSDVFNGSLQACDVLNQYGGKYDSVGMERFMVLVDESLDRLDKLKSRYNEILTMNAKMVDRGDSVLSKNQQSIDDIIQLSRASDRHFLEEYRAKDNEEVSDFIKRVTADTTTKREDNAQTLRLIYNRLRLSKRCTTRAKPIVDHCSQNDSEKIKIMKDQLMLLLDIRKEKLEHLEKQKKDSVRLETIMRALDSYEEDYAARIKKIWDLWAEVIGEHALAGKNTKHMKLMSIKAGDIKNIWKVAYILSRRIKLNLVTKYLNDEKSKSRRSVAPRVLAKLPKDAQFEYEMEFQRLVDPKSCLKEALLDSGDWTGDQFSFKNLLGNPAVETRVLPLFARYYYSRDSNGDLVRYEMPRCAGGSASEQQVMKMFNRTIRKK